MQPLRPPPYSLDLEVLAGEVEIDTFRASGPGGQHVNTTSSALRLRHRPSGVVVIAQDTPSQARNKAIAFERLISKLKHLNHVPARRIATQPTRGSKERRLEAKRRAAMIKRDRSLRD